MLKIVTDNIFIEKEEDIEGVKKEIRKGEEVWMEMWERERVEKVVKKEMEEEDIKEGKEDWKDGLEGENDTTFYTDAEYLQVIS